VREERTAEVREKARQSAEGARARSLAAAAAARLGIRRERANIREQAQRTREKLREQLRDGRLDHKQVEIDVREKSFPSFEIIQGGSIEEIDINVKEMLPGLFQGRTRKRRVPVPEAIEALRQEEEQKLVDMESVARAAGRARAGRRHHLHRRDRQGGRPRGRSRPRREPRGVQRDILPIVEGRP
jgi:ATP-dependent HslUV protease ATP-binding subunit HslU